MKLLIATRNVHKTREIRSFLKPLSHLDLYTLADFPNYQPLAEQGSSFEEIAISKATHAASQLGLWAIGDDSGLVVPALGGAPGIFSARYSGIDATDAKNRKKLLHEMAQLDDLSRGAFFECHIALASPEGLKQCVHSICEGEITRKERGGNGFGYDPVFQKYDYRHTFAELEEAVKVQISHRGKAMQKLLLLLEAIPQEE